MSELKAFKIISKWKNGTKIIILADDKLCCDSEMVQIMEDNFQMAGGLFGRCDTCMKNFRKSICALNCSPNQTQFMTPYIEHHEDIKYVESIDLYMDEKYVNDVFDSCRGVNIPATGGIAMDMACGFHTSKTCTAKLWYEYMGDPISNIFVPFAINYIYNDTERAFRAETLPCNESYPNSAACSCVDCQLSCPVGEEPTEDLHPEIALFVFIFSIVLIVILASIVIIGLRFPGEITHCLQLN